MIRPCDHCDVLYDDATRFTICPHWPFISAEDATRKDRAVALLGKNVVWAATGEPARITSVGRDGFVTVGGYQHGQFNPDLFTLVE